MAERGKKPSRETGSWLCVAESISLGRRVESVVGWEVERESCFFLGCGLPFGLNFAPALAIPKSQIHMFQPNDFNPNKKKRVVKLIKVDKGNKKQLPAGAAGG